VSLRIGGAIVAALVGLGACAPAMGTIVPQSAGGAEPAASQRDDRLRIEPFEIAFKRGKSQPAAAVRVWEPRYKGYYAVANRCGGVVVTLKKYTDSHASIWSVQADGSAHESCRVEFVGSAGARGTNYLEIRVLR
jgi:hypothetical protein